MLFGPGLEESKHFDYFISTKVQNGMTFFLLYREPEWGLSSPWFSFLMTGRETHMQAAPVTQAELKGVVKLVETALLCQGFPLT